MQDTLDQDAIDEIDHETNTQPATTAPGDGSFTDDEIAALAGAACELLPAVEWTGKELKYAYKTGTWSDGKEAEPIGADERFGADARSFAEVWKRWGKLAGQSKRSVTDMIGGRRVDGWINPGRDAMPENDESKWPRNDDGKPEDPWQEEARMVLRRLSDGQLFTWSARYGDRKGMGELLDAVAREARSHPGCAPIVVLEAVANGKNFHPRLRIVGWQPFGEGASPPANPTRLERLKEDLRTLHAKYAPGTAAAKAKTKRGEMEDEIPF
jgi:hypothetical protein